MKKKTIVVTIIIIMAGVPLLFLYLFFNGIPYPKDNNSLFPDRYLEKIVREEIGMSRGEITAEDCLNITELNLSRDGYDYFKDLEGLQYFVDLVSLRATGGNLKDISALSELENLKSLDLSFNKIMDLSPLADITSLEVLIVNNNRIEDVSPLYSLPNLKEVVIYKNYIYDEGEFRDRKDVIFRYDM